MRENLNLDWKKKNLLKINKEKLGTRNKNVAYNIQNSNIQNSFFILIFCEEIDLSFIRFECLNDDEFYQIKSTKFDNVFYENS